MEEGPYECSCGSLNYSNLYTTNYINTPLPLLRLLIHFHSHYQTISNSSAHALRQPITVILYYSFHALPLSPPFLPFLYLALHPPAHFPRLTSTTSCLYHHLFLQFPYLDLLQRGAMIKEEDFYYSLSPSFPDPFPLSITRYGLTR